ncbi:MAG: cache domain-containing protein [Hyphomicrobiaceae bacterium]|nr:cache domain-containing protein [Hyphomicrobiaceae bacterium]
MLRKLVSSLGALVVFGTGVALAQQFGTAAEAKAMLDKAVAAVKVDKAKALAAFTAGSDGFKDRDLYPFCANVSDGLFSAHPTLTGKSLKDLKDKDGKVLGEAILTTAQEGKVSEVEYKWTRPGSDQPVAKVSFVTKIGDQVCAVGYYK